MSIFIIFVPSNTYNFLFESTINILLFSVVTLLQANIVPISDCILSFSIPSFEKE